MDKKTKRALEIIHRCGGIQGDHHKEWLLNEIVKILCENEEDYKKWVDEYEQGGEYEWSLGIAP